MLDLPLEGKTATAERRHAGRRRIAIRLIERFASSFPQITYRLIWESPIINAQAWRLGETSHVYLYGGLIRHPSIEAAGLALTLAHETGHHLGGAPYDEALIWMTSEDQADCWAVKEGMPTVFGKDARVLILRGAKQIHGLQREFADKSDQLGETSALRYQTFVTAAAGAAGETS